ncbi:MAG: SDR family oxidoreductase [Chitinophagales bacterium]
MSNKKRVFITGGASGLGKALAEKYAKEGYAVCIGDINDDEGKAVVHELAQKYTVDVIFKHCDVTSESSLQKVADELLQEWDGVDVVINNAGVATSASIDGGSLDDWEWVININLLGVVRGCKVFTPVFKRQGSGYFINIASMAGIIHLPLMGSYNATKAAVVALSETLKMELADDNIGVTVVCPSFFKTNLDATMRSNEQMKQTVRKLFDKSPINAEDVAKMVYDAHQKEDFYVITHKKGKTAFWMKKLLPTKIYHQNLYKETKAFRKKKSGSS